MSLPSIYQNKNIKISTNQQDFFYGNIEENKEPISKYHDIRNDIRRLFTSKNYVYKLNCLITTKDKTINTYVIGNTNNDLITIDNELIPIKDIIDIKEKY